MSKCTLEDCNSISIGFLKKYKYLEKDSYKSGRLIWISAGNEIESIGLSVDIDNEVINFKYISTDNDTNESVDKNFSITLLKTPCNYGGFRYWFSCPCCGGRVGNLYLYCNSDFICRKCSGLAYKSQNNNSLQRFVGKIMSGSELDEFRAKIRPYYKGKRTRNYKRYLKNVDRFSFAVRVTAKILV